MKRILLATVAIVAAVPAHAALTLTATGISDGFTLTTFFSGGGPGTYNDLSNALLGDGGVAAVDYSNGQLVKFTNVDGQTSGSALTSQSLASVINIARANGVTYTSVYGGGLYSVSNSLGLTAVSVPGFNFGYGLWANGANGHLLTAGYASGIYDINPVTGTSTLVSGSSGKTFDGVTVSPDGKRVYGESAGQILGYDIATGTQVFAFTSSHNPDGTGVIAGGTYDGYIVINNNDGTVELVDPTATISAVIASGGSRGDFASADPSGGTLWLSEYGFNYRLGVEGGSIGTTDMPEPASLTLFGAALAGIGLLRRRR